MICRGQGIGSRFLQEIESCLPALGLKGRHAHHGPDSAGIPVL